MSEIGYAEKVVSQREQLRTFLLEHQIIVPQEPLLDPHVEAPREWLIRGESHKERLLKPAEHPFVPQSGEWGTYGIFFGDCMKPLMYPHSGAYYLYRTEDLRSDWLVDPSEEYEKTLSEIAEKEHLKMTSVTQGVQAIDMVYHQNNIYQAKRGIATLHSSLAVEKASAIVYTSNFLSSDELASVPSSVRDKLVKLNI